MYGNFPAKNTVFTYVCMVLANPNYEIMSHLVCIFIIFYSDLAWHRQV
jgi:hypothetical protein